MIKQAEKSRKWHRHTRLLSTVCAVGLIGAALPASAKDRCNEALVPQPPECQRSNADVVVSMPTGSNTELISHAPGTGFAATGFAISIDNRTVAGAAAPIDPRRPNDIAAAGANVDIRFEGLRRQRLLNVSTANLRASYRAGEQVVFRSSTNYPQYLKYAEIRVVDRAKRGRPIVARLPIAPNGQAQWQMPADGSGDFAYMLRVYDAKGRYDETVALDLNRSSRALPTHDMVGGPIIAAGEGQDRTRRRGIPVRGGQIVAHGSGVVPGTKVRVLGETVPVDANGKFVVSRILPAGDHIITVELQNGRNIRKIRRDVEIPRSEWFGVAIVDLTFGRRLDDDLAASDPDYKATYVDGRLAYYVKGNTQSGFQITSSLDTGEGELEDVFRRLDEKDPRHVLQRLDPEDVYPTYGDDSSAYDDTPTSGRFYVRAENEQMRFTWGDFRADIAGSKLLSQSRELYGAEFRYKSVGVTKKGEHKAAVTLYAASPDTLPQRDILRGTGGSVYFLSHQDINGASESISVQVVDPDTGRIIETRRMVAGVDYEIDYIQGVLNLTSPLNSSTSDGGLFTSVDGDYDVNLVATYEYTPTASTLDGASYGGRAEFWLRDNLRFGVSGFSDETGAADQTALGLDVRYELGQLSYIEAELAQTEGPGFGRSISTDGGLTNTSTPMVVNPRARAYRLDAHLDFADLGSARPGSLGFYYERKEAGFSTLNEDITQDQTLVGVKARVEMSERLKFGMKLERFEKAGGDEVTEGDITVAYKLNDVWSVEAGLAHEDRTTIGDATKTGRLTQFGLRVNYQPHEDLLVYGFGQTALSHSGGLQRNDRAGIGFDTRLTEKLSVAGEISGGNRGTGGNLSVRYSPTADNEIYLGYTLDPTRTGAGYNLVGEDRGTIVLGSKFRHSEKLSTYAEQNLDLFGERRSITRAFGVNYTPNAEWSYSASVELGDVRDSINGDFDRQAFSFGVAYDSGKGQRARGRLEYRTEDGVGIAQDRDTWAFSGGYEYHVSKDWRFLANVDALYSDSAQSDFRDGEYLEAGLGFAYRPVDNDRLNLLLRYTFLHDFPGQDQVTVDGSTNGPKQRSHIISVDGSYDISPKLTFGAKYGYRRSELTDRVTNVKTDSTAHLGIVRLDWHVVHKWDLMAEGRVLYTEQTRDRETGALIGLYRHFGNNVKAGIGYEWGRVSDDLSNINYKGRGVFFNVIAKF